MSSFSRAQCCFRRGMANSPDKIFRFSLHAWCVFLKIAVSSTVEEFLLSSNSAVVASVWVGETQVLSIYLLEAGWRLGVMPTSRLSAGVRFSQSDEND